MAITKAIRSAVKEYHTYHGDKNIRVIREVEPNVFLVHIVDVAGRAVSVLDSVIGNDVSELAFESRENENNLFDFLEGGEIDVIYAGKH